MTFEYCLITAGASLNRAPSEQRWEKGDVLSLDSGGNYHGYIGDLCRMAIQGEPDAELDDLLAEIEDIQRASMKPIKAGVMGGEIYARGRAAGRQVEAPQSHALPRARHGAGQPRGAAADRDRSGALRRLRRRRGRSRPAWWCRSRRRCSIRKRGFIKLEDTVVVTDTGYDIYGEGGARLESRRHGAATLSARRADGTVGRRPGERRIFSLKQGRRSGSRRVRA